MVRGLPAHGGIHQGNGQFVKVRGLPAHGRIRQVRGLPTHGRIRQGKGVYPLMGEFVKVRSLRFVGKGFIYS